MIEPARASQQAAQAAAALGIAMPLGLAALSGALFALARLAWAHPVGPQRWLLLASLVAALAAAWFALRCRFDQGLFEAWARRWERGLPSQPDLEGFDQWLGRCPGAPPRPLAERVRGALGLLRKLGLAVLLQYAVLLGAALDCC